MRSADSYKRKILTLRAAHTSAFEKGQWSKMQAIREKLILELNGFAEHYLDLNHNPYQAAQ